jgi:antitoxin component of RelBE/YafQ-DinJ toxin-antitoxin module
LDLIKNFKKGVNNMNMTIEQALQILDQAASRALLPRQDHYQVQVAVETIKAEFEKLRKELEETKGVEKKESKSAG